MGANPPRRTIIFRETMKLPAGIIELASSQATKSPMGYRHGSVVFKGNNIIGAGYNWPAAPPTDEHRRFSIHSERDALKGLHGTQILGSNVFSVRVTKGGALANAAPCTGCRKLLKRKGIKNVYWIEDGEVVSLRLN